MKTGHFSAGHSLAILILLLVPLGVYAKSIRFFGKFGVYIQTVVLSSTLFFSMIPAVVETLTRLPIANPLAASPDAPIVKMGLTTLVFLYLIGILYQIIKIKTQKNKDFNTPDSSINLS